jgi:hypothetical protein
MGCSAGRGGVWPSSLSLREMGIGRVTASFTTSSVRSDPYQLVGAHRSKVCSNKVDRQVGLFWTN